VSGSVGQEMQPPRRGQGGKKKGQKNNQTPSNAGGVGVFGKKVKELKKAAKRKWSGPRVRELSQKISRQGERHEKRKQGERPNG